MRVSPEYMAAKDDLLTAQRERIKKLEAALHREMQRYYSLADKYGKRGKHDTQDEFWDKAEEIKKILGLTAETAVKPFPYPMCNRCGQEKCACECESEGS